MKINERAWITVLGATLIIAVVSSCGKKTAAVNNERNSLLIANAVPTGTSLPTPEKPTPPSMVYQPDTNLNYKIQRMIPDTNRVDRMQVINPEEAWKKSNQPSLQLKSNK